MNSLLSILIVQELPTSPIAGTLYFVVGDDKTYRAFVAGFDGEAGYVALSVNDLDALLAQIQGYVDEAAEEAGLAADAAAASASSANASAASAALALVNGKLYATTGAGISATSSGDYFLVVGSGNLYAELYKNIAGVATDQNLAIPSLTALLAVATFPVSERFAVLVEDANAAGPHVAEYVDRTGKRVIAAATIRTLNGLDADSFIRGARPFAAKIPGDVLHINADGQSLMDSGVGGGNFTLSPDGPSYAWPRDVNSPAQATQVPLTSDSVVATGLVLSTVAEPHGQSPLFGCISMLRQLLLDEDGIAYSDGPSIFTGNNSVGSTAISAHQSGTTPYINARSQESATRDAAALLGLRGRALGTIWGQGEADIGGTAADYYAALLTLAQSQRTSIRANLPHQEFDPILITYATASFRVSGPPSPNNFPVARAQHKLAIDQPALVGFSSAIYQLPYSYDTGSYPNYNDAGLHPTKEGAHWEGAYYGLTLKRKMFDGLTWLPMNVVAVQREGNSVFVTYAIRGDRLVIDTDWVPLQSNYGVIVINEAGGGTITQTQVPRIVSDRVYGSFRTVCITLNTPPIDGFRLDMAMTPAVKLFPYVGAASNFRDDYGVRLKDIDRPLYDPMPPHSIRLKLANPGWEYVL